MSDDHPKQVYRRTLTGFAPASKAAEAFWTPTKLGEFVELPGKKPRSIKHHRLFWAMLDIAAENSDYNSSEDVLFILKGILDLGKWVTPKKATREIFLPASISFAAMDQTEFAAFFDKALAAICKHILHGANVKEVEQELWSMVA